MNRGDLRKTYRRVYDLVRPLNYRRMEEIELVNRWLDAGRNERILDVGCGDGFYSTKLSERGARVVGVDVSRARLAVARSHAGKTLAFARADATRLPFADGVFDKAVSYCVIEHFENDAAVLGEVRRVLRPGGKLVLSADSLSCPGLTADERAAHQRRYSVQNFYRIETLTQRLGEAGFAATQAQYLLTSRLSIALARGSWALDDFPKVLAPIKWAGYLALATFGKRISDAMDARIREPENGLTVVMAAERV